MPQVVFSLQLSVFPSTNYLSPNDWLNTMFRLCLALVIGLIIGLERQLQHKPAGLRTHMLVSFGSAIFTLIPLQVSAAHQSVDSLSRVIQGIAAGVGFLGAGEIVRQSTQKDSHLPEVHGLTSAAAIWVSAGLGIAAGCGLWQLGLTGALFSLLVLKILKKLE
ncbi:MgtC/SapB family protein [Aetokthonos hydrillicola Thurmond2011]|jgi:putative Mg2+ transporter-C (MgtC) family protein|uniref:MgtC/SapB family protein n=1 Tax=Aetokthonos hydrillicola Thurmond2011 TaxID=2712845 RepID=A0AAP5IB70_9CYAN|nr:MgtC/SapB family protein [Aetokthonos hydrillicola]MBO3459207.1 MgtC/SapB family protein [Aetokthonos hydrillicola CCALA 1050]MBW4584166.1 MgtC/SapB family protein [Aetokthonos hydrillicola CCALA 1050]MDR9898301.1 MgtC/SapB family protein [Aetokthonos hydrillicola Thurmond2011]